MAMRMICHGSYALAKLTDPETDGDTICSAEGVATHWTGETSLATGGMLLPIDFENTYAPNGVWLTESLLEAPTEYVSHVLDTIRDIGGDVSKLEIECHVDLSWVDAEMFGTCDCRYRHGNTLYVWDYKNGYDAVEATDNPQLAFYALDDRTIERAICFIVQPNAGGIKSVEYTRADLDKWALKFREVAAACRADGASRVASNKCRYCPAAARCPENMAEAWSRYVTATTPTPDISDEMDAIEAALLLLKARKEAVTQRAYNLAYKSGVHIPRYKIVEGAKQRQWRDEEELIAYCDLMGVDPYEKKLLTPAKLSRIIDIGEYAYKPEGSVKLVKENARGTPIPTAVQSRFAGITGGTPTPKGTK